MGSNPGQKNDLSDLQPVDRRTSGQHPVSFCGLGSFGEIEGNESVSKIGSFV